MLIEKGVLEGSGLLPELSQRTNVVGGCVQTTGMRKHKQKS